LSDSSVTPSVAATQELFVHKLGNFLFVTGTLGEEDHVISARIGDISFGFDLA
jgi:hypothetical protein